MSDIGKGIGTLAIWAAVAAIAISGNVITDTVNILGFFAVIATAFIWGS